METTTKNESHCWWFNSHNTPKSSLWLQSTLAELTDKTKTMLKLIEEDADSFAQRAEMYYKKRPELISMVEDFYRAHRSLAERYDQLKSERAVRVRSPLRHSFSLPKEEYEYVFDAVNSVKSFDSFTEVAYSSEEAAESEIDDPEEDEVDAPTNVVEEESEAAFAGGASYDELMKLRDELDRLRGENEIQKSIIKQKDEEKYELVKLLSDNIRELREEMAEVREENLGVVMKPTGEALVPFDEVTNFMDENLLEKKQAKKKDDEFSEVMEKFDAEKTKNRHLEHALSLKEEKNVEITRQCERLKSELAELREEMRRELEGKEAETREAIEHMKNALAEREEKEEAMRQLNSALTKRNKEAEAVVGQLKDALVEKDNKFEEMKRHLMNTIEAKQMEAEDTIKQLKDALVEKDNKFQEMTRHLMNTFEAKQMEAEDAIKHLKDALAEKDEENREAIRHLKNTFEAKEKEVKHAIKQLKAAVTEKDEEKREAIRQLSVGMEIVREESKLLKKSLLESSPRKSNADFQIFRGVNLGKLFSPSPKSKTRVLPF